MAEASIGMFNDERLMKNLTRRDFLKKLAKLLWQ
jgi:hypothetical protein